MTFAKASSNLKQLPEDLIFIDWGYHKSYPFDEHLKMLAELKIPLWRHREQVPGHQLLRLMI